MTQTDPNRKWLDNALIEAHAGEDVGALIELYEQAGITSEQSGDIVAACFYYTHAYIFALEKGVERAVSLKQRLMRHGCER